MLNFDDEMMQKAIDLSVNARYASPPNPWVGCIIVKNGKIVSDGFTLAPGSSHAEIVALEKAGSHARGATLYVTLEPCCHYGRTPPCTKALIDAKVSRVVIGMQDPDHKVSGHGIRLLQEAGIEVTYGVLEKQIALTLLPYIYHRKTGLSYCIGKAATSIDGRIAAADGTSKWISSKEALKEVHRLRAESQAIVIGARTAIYDKPSLTVRHPEIKVFTPPLRIVLSSDGSLDSTGPLFDSKDAKTLIVTTKKASHKNLEALVKKGIEVVTLPENENGIDLQEFVKFLGKRDIVQTLVEGGGSLLGSFLENGLLQEFHTFIGPIFLGNKGVPLIRTSNITTLNDSFKMSFNNLKIFGDTVNINYIQKNI